MSSYTYQQSQQQQQKKSKALIRPVTGAVNNGSGLIRITSPSHTFRNNDRIAVTGVGGTVEANGNWQALFVDASHFDLKGSTFTNAYTSGGTAKRTS